MTLLPVSKRITNREEYDAAVAVILEILESGQKSARRDEFDLLYLLTKDYENSKPSVLGPPPKSHEMLEFFMEQHAMRQADLVKFLGISRSAVSSILAGRIPIPRAAAHKLKAKFGGFDFPAMIAQESAARPLRPRRKRTAKRKV